MSHPEFTNERLGILHGITLDEPPEVAPRKRRKTEPEATITKTESAPPHSPSRDADNSKSSEPRKSKFRFKKKKRSGSSSCHSEKSSQGPADHSSSRRRRKEHHATFYDDPSQYDDTYIPNTASWRYTADPDAAFRESLFDAMADDEGAAFWEGVYGQPIHVYERSGFPDSRGELERMTDDEYARYVREKMWEKSHQHIMEERERREKKRAQKKEEEKGEQKRQERERRERKTKEMAWKEHQAVQKMRKRWEDYIQRWETLGGPGDIPWPIASGKARDVTKDAVEEFILAKPTDQVLQDVLKTERIRWHPDKAQQRWGIDALTEVEMRAITTVFQTVDALWNKCKGQGEGAR